jgi:MFS family permease
MSQLVLLRAVQGLAGGGVLVLSQAVVADAVPARNRGQFMAPVGLVFAVASVVAPLVGGILTDTVGWRWVFWVNLPLGVAALSLAAWSIPRSSGERPRGRLDIRGAIYYGVAVTGLVGLTATIGGGDKSPLAGTVLVAVTAIGGYAFARRMLRHHDPLIPVRVLRNRTVAVSSYLGFTVGVAVFALVGFLPTIVQTVLDVPATASGALVLALILGMMVTVFGSSAWIARTGRYRRLPLVGSVAATVAMVALSGLSASWSVLHTAAWVALLGAGVGCFMQLATTMAQEATPADHVGSATSTVSLCRELGVTIGAASIGAVLAASTDAGPVLLTLAVILASAGVASLLLPRHQFDTASPLH